MPARISGWISPTPLHQAAAFFVTRAKSNMDAHRVYSAPTDRATGIICDQTIALDGHYTSQHYADHLRRIRFHDPETAKTLIFLTNNFALPAATICALYKSRWQVDIDQSWRLSRLSGWTVGVAQRRRQTTPWNGRRSDGFEIGNRGGIGRHQLRSTGAGFDRAAA